MFTLGNKEAIVNGSGQYTATAVGPGTSLDIKSFGKFGAAANASNIMCQTYLPETFGAGTVAVPSASTLGVPATAVGAAVNFLLRINTSRYSSEWATDFIRRGRPYVFQINVNGSDTGAQIAAKLVDVFIAYETEYTTTDNQYGSLPFDWTRNGANVTLQLKHGDLSFMATTVFQIPLSTFGYNVTMSAIPGGTFDTGLTADIHGAITAGSPVGISASPAGILEVGMVVSITDDTSAKVGTITDIVDNGASSTITLNVNLQADATTGPILMVVGTTLSGSEARLDGKYLEENVRMSTAYTDGAYTIKPGERPLINSKYVMLSWEYPSPIQGSASWKGHKRLFTDAVDIDANSTPQIQKFSLYFNADVFMSALPAVGAATDGTGVVANSDLASVLSWLNANVTAADWASGTIQDWS